MKATEFVKKYGIGKAVGILHEWNMFTQIEKPTHFDSDLDIFIHEGDFYSLDESDVCLIELKNLVNAYELVESGLPELKKAMFSDSKDLDYVKKWVLTVSEKLLTEKGIKLKQAIELLESVNE